MSKLPTPARMPGPKSVSGTATKAAEHDRLLRLVWERIVPLVASLYVHDARNVVDRSEAEGYERDADRAIDLARQWMQDANDAGDVAALGQLIERISWARQSGVPEITADLYVPQICATTLEAEVRNHDGDRILGFVDVEVEMHLAVSFYLDSGLPNFSVSKDAEKPKRPEWLTTDEVKALEVSPPTWNRPMRDRRTLWIDVRPVLGPIGQLLKELKQLRDAANSPTDIVVVCSGEDDQAFEMLRHEGFVLMPERTLLAL